MLSALYAGLSCTSLRCLNANTSSLHLVYRRWKLELVTLTRIGPTRTDQAMQVSSYMGLSVRPFVLIQLAYSETIVTLLRLPLVY